MVGANTTSVYPCRSCEIPPAHVRANTEKYCNPRACAPRVNNYNTCIIAIAEATSLAGAGCTRYPQRVAHGQSLIRPDKLDLLFLISHFLDLGAGGRLLFITSLFKWP